MFTLLLIDLQDATDTENTILEAVLRLHLYQNLGFLTPASIPLHEVHLQLYKLTDLETSLHQWSLRYTENADCA